MTSADSIPRFLEKFGRDTSVDIFARVTSRNRVRYRIHAKWRYMGKGVPMVPVSFSRIPYRAALSTTGRLEESIGYYITKEKDGWTITFTMEEYWAYIENGRKPFGQMGPPHKGIPPAILEKWIKDKGIRPRDAQGRFQALTKSNINTLSYLINRKIKHFGIEPVPFFEEGFNDSMKVYQPKFREMGLEYIAEELITRFKKIEDGS